MTSGEQPGATFSITRSLVIRATGTIDGPSASSLERILNDLINDHEVTNLVLDLSLVAAMTAEVGGIIDRTHAGLASLGGLLELRLPHNAPTGFVDLGSDTPTFVQIDPADLHDQGSDP